MSFDFFFFFFFFYSNGGNKPNYCFVHSRENIFWDLQKIVLREMLPIGTTDMEDCNKTLPLKSEGAQSTIRGKFVSIWGPRFFNTLPPETRDTMNCTVEKKKELRQNTHKLCRSGQDVAAGSNNLSELGSSSSEAELLDGRRASQDHRKVRYDFSWTP